ncbi:hypothetical protein HK405_009070, partial [Cladochytrium tenue]
MDASEDPASPHHRRCNRDHHRHHHHHASDRFVQQQPAQSPPRATPSPLHVPYAASSVLPTRSSMPMSPAGLSQPRSSRATAATAAADPPALFPHLPAGTFDRTSVSTARSPAAASASAMGAAARRPSALLRGSAPSRPGSQASPHVHPTSILEPVPSSGRVRLDPLRTPTTPLADPATARSTFLATLQAALPAMPTGRQTHASPSATLPPVFDDMQCYICFESMVRPVMCPACSKIGCSDCVTRWLHHERNQCPHCRRPLVASQLVPCRFMNDLEKHKSHSLEKLQAVWSTQRARIKAIIDDFADRTTCLSGAESLADVGISRAARERSELERCHQALVRKAADDIDAHMARCKRLMEDEKSKLRSDLDDARTAADLLGRFMAESSMADLVHYEPRLSELARRHLQDAPAVPFAFSTPPFSSCLVPDYDTAELAVDDFAHRREAGDVVFSPPLRAAGLAWRLK